MLSNIKDCKNFLLKYYVSIKFYITYLNKYLQLFANSSYSVTFNIFVFTDFVGLNLIDLIK